jgi:hypothetical protein
VSSLKSWWPGRVEQRDVMAFELELERRGTDRDAALLFHLHPVGHRVALGLAAAHRPRQLDGARIQQQLLRQRRLARVRVRDDGEGAAPGDFRRQRLLPGDEIFSLRWHSASQ